MNYKNTVSVINREDVQRSQFEETSKCFTKRGLVIMWAAMLLMTVAFLAPTPLTRMVCFISFATAGLFYFLAAREGVIFEYIAFEKNHTGRQIIERLIMVVIFVGFIHLAIHSNPIIFLVVGLAVAMATTVLRFVGEKQ